MRRTPRAAVLGVAAMATFGLSGCGEDSGAPSPTTPAAAPVSAPPMGEPGEAPAVAPLPPPSELTDVLNRIADAGVPGTDKTALVEGATAEDAAAMDRFGQALRDGGYAPVTFEAADLRWAEEQPGNVLAVVTVNTANPQAGAFAFPMEFHQGDGGWQLTRRTADTLLQFGPNPTPTPTP